MKFKILLGFVLLFFSITNAQDCIYTFSGTIKDYHNSAALEEAVVKITELNRYTTTNKNGFFKFENLCKGKFTIEISHVACENKNVKVDLNNNLNKEIFLEHHLEELNEVVVDSHLKSEKTSIEKSVKKNVIDNFTDKSLGDALNTVSGVSSLTTGNSIVKPIIHGLHSSRLLIINNNVRMFDQEWGDEHAPNIDINASDRIDVVKGANTLKYGSDAIGGLVLLKPKKYAKKDSLFGSTMLSLNSNGWGGNINSELIKTYKSGFYTKLQANYKQFGDFNAPDYNLTNTGLNSLNASVRLGFNSFEKGFDAYYSYVNNEFAILSASHVGNTNDLYEALNSEKPRIIDDFSYTINNPSQSITHHLAKIEAFKRFKDLGKLTLQYDFQLNRRKEFDTRRGNLKDTPVIDLQLITNSIQPNLQIDSFDDLKINTGFLLRYQQNEAFSTGVRPLIPDYTKFDAGVYAIGVFNINETTKLSSGIRYDYSNIDASKRYNLFDWNTTYNYDELFPEFEVSVNNTRILTNPKFTFHNTSVSLGFEKRFENNLTLLANYGLAQRTPNPSELFSDGLHHSAARIEIGFLTMKKEAAHKFAVSLEKNNADFGFSINPYFKHINDFIQLIPFDEETTVRGSFIKWKYIQTDAQIFGVDIDVNKKITDKIDYKGSISLLKGTNTTDDIPLIHMPATNFSNSISYINEELNQLSISLTHKTILQQNNYPDYNFFTYNATLQQDVFVDISSTPPTYSLFGLQASTVFKTKNNGSLKLEFNVENLFNTSYREHLNRLRYFADDLGRNINLKLKLNY